MEQNSYVRSVRAEKVAPGHRFITRTGAPSLPVASVRTVQDSFGTPAYVEAVLESGQTATIAYGSSIRVHTTEPPPEVTLDELTVIPVEDGSPEAVLIEIAREYPWDQRVLEPIARLSRGFNAKAGAHLEDVRLLARLLLVDLQDRANAWRALGILTELPFDGNFGRWKTIQLALAAASYLAFDDGDAEAADRYAEALRATDHVEADPVRSRLGAELRQRQLDEPNLFDREIHRAAATGDRESEREWRLQRFEALLHLRAHGGSRTLGADELARMIRHELDALRGLAGEGPDAPAG
ncbi:DUF6707 family protein [Zafaria sp. Z1313]|uniref:DUF6707 family protein n=1 Tax=unclassified Zafaria TaxID=2828765 RepID=UPI002E7989B9|nr:DUF6707 family protein [Zafaria sp. J156]MEE1621857.1 DUF6707 family protein [Zafaria sp. J156]